MGWRGCCAQCICINHYTGARDELKSDIRCTSFDKHCTIITVVAYFTPRYGRGESINRRAAQAIDKVWEAIEYNALIRVIMPSQYRICAPGLIWPLHYRCRSMSCSRRIG